MSSTHPGEQRAGAQIGAQAFIQAVVILFVLMMAAGALTRLLPAGAYTRLVVGEREVIDPQSFRYVERPDYPVWRWFSAPVEALWGPDGLTVIVILIFLLMIGGSFAVLDRSGILKAAVAYAVRAFGGRKYALLLVISLLFMLVGAFFGIFEEVVPLVPVMIALAYYLGWDALVGLGMSILATNMGFSAAIMNPFTLGVAQKIADLPLFSGAWLRVLIFAAVYAVYAAFLAGYARRIERDPQSSLVFAESSAARARYADFRLDDLAAQNPRLGRAMGWFLACFVLILLALVSGPFLPALSDYLLPIVGLLFMIAGIGAGLMAGNGGRAVLRAAWEGLVGIAPGIPLILMAASIKYIIAQGGILDTILHSATQPFSQASPFFAALLVYFLALLIEFFISSGSAKAFLVMPILLPLSDLVGVTRQTAVTAYCFGDGFSNMAYPTNPVLLICLGLAAVSYAKWLRWTFKLWLGVLLVTLVFLGIGVAIGYGPF